MLHIQQGTRLGNWATQLSEAELKKVTAATRRDEAATVWDRIVDWFCGTKRTEAKKLYFDACNNPVAAQRASSFLALRELAGEGYRGNFRITQNDTATQYVIDRPVAHADGPYLSLTYSHAERAENIWARIRDDYKRIDQEDARGLVQDLFSSELDNLDKVSRFLMLRGLVKGAPAPTDGTQLQLRSAAYYECFTIDHAAHAQHYVLDTGNPADRLELTISTNEQQTDLLPKQPAQASGQKRSVTFADDRLNPQMPTV